MANAQVETINTTGERAKVWAGAALIVAAVVVYYVLGEKDLWLRVLAMLAVMGLGVALFFTSEMGKTLIAFGKDSERELRKVVWPTRQEAMQMTMYVFGFVLVMALFLWITDKTLEWLVYSVLLGWKH